MSKNLELEALLTRSRQMLSEVYYPGRDEPYDTIDALIQAVESLIATRPDTGDLVSGEDGAKLLAEARDFAERMTSQPWACELVERMADFISRLSTAPAGDVVAWEFRNRYPHDPDLDRGVLERGTWELVRYKPLWADASIEDGSAEWRPLYAAPTPSPQTSPATEGEVVAHVVENPGSNLISWHGRPPPVGTLLYAAPPPAKAGEGDPEELERVETVVKRLLAAEAERDKLREALRRVDAKPLDMWEAMDAARGKP